MHSTLLCNDTASRRQSNNQIPVLGTDRASWSFSKKPFAETALKPEQWGPPAAWRPLGNIATSKPVVVCLRKETPVERRNAEPCHVRATTKRPAVEHLKKADTPEWTTISKSPVCASLPPSGTTNASQVTNTKVPLTLPSNNTAIRKGASPTVVRVKILSPKCLARGDSAKRCQPSLAECETANPVSGRGKHVVLKRTPTKLEADQKVIKIVSRLPKNSDVKPEPEQGLKLGRSGKPSAAREVDLGPRKVQRKLSFGQVEGSKEKVKEEVLSHKRQGSSQSFLKTAAAKQPKRADKLLPDSLKEKSRTVGRQVNILKEEEVKPKAPSARESGKVLAQKVSKDPPLRPQRAGRKRSLELVENVPLFGSKKLDSSMQVPQRRVSVDSSVDDCPMPLLEPLVEEKDVTVKKEEPNSPEMPMLLPVIVKSEVVAQPKRIRRRQSGQNIECGRVEGNAVVDTIDGVDFYSFSCEEDLEDFSREFEEVSSMEECPWSQSLTADDSELLNSDVADSQVLLPRKTNDITKIKGWRKKSFGTDMPVATSIKQEDMAVTMAEVSKGVRSAFVSDSLNDFLDNKSALRVVHLAKLNPNITPPPEGSGVLSLRSQPPFFQDTQVEKETESKMQTRAAAAAVGRYSTRKLSTTLYSAEHRYASPSSPATKPDGTPQALRPTRRHGRPSKLTVSPQEVRIKTEPVDEDDSPFLAMTSRNLRPSTMKSTPESVAKQSLTPSPVKTTAIQTTTATPKLSPNLKMAVKPYGSESDYEIIRDSFVTDAQEVLLKSLLGCGRKNAATSKTHYLDREPAFICPQLDHQDAAFASEALLAYEVYSGRANAASVEGKGKSTVEETRPAKTSPTVRATVTSPVTPTSTSAASPTASGAILNTTRSRRPIRLPARFQDSALLLPSGGDLWDLSSQRCSGQRQRSKTIADNTKNTPTHVTAASITTTVSTPAMHGTVPQTRLSTVAHPRLSNPHSVPALPSPMSSSSSSSVSSSSSESDENSPPQSDADEEEDDRKGSASLSKKPKMEETAVVSCAVQELSNAGLECHEDNSNEIDIETVSDLTDSTPTVLSEDDSNSQDKKGNPTGFSTMLDTELDALDNAESMECKASRERIRRRVMLSLFINLQNTVFAAPSAKPRVAVLPKVAILTQAVKYLNGLKALSLHLDGEKRRLRQRHSQLEAQLRIAKSGGPVKLEPGPSPRVMPPAVTAVCDVQSPNLGPLSDVATEVLLATQRKRLGLEEPVPGNVSGASTPRNVSGASTPRNPSGASTPKRKKSKVKHEVAANGKKKLGRVSVTTKKPGTLAPSKTTAQDEGSESGASYTLDGRNIGSLRSIVPKTTPSSTSTTTVTPAPTTPGSPQKYTLYPARGTMLGDLSKVAAVAQHLIGPCVIKRVKLRTGQTVLIYRKSPSGEGGEVGENDNGGIVLVPEEHSKIPLTIEGSITNATSMPGSETDPPQASSKKTHEKVGEKSAPQESGKGLPIIPGGAKLIPLQSLSTNACDVAKTNHEKQKSERGTTDSPNVGVRTSHSRQTHARKTMKEAVHVTKAMSAEACAKGLVGPSRTAKSASAPQPFFRTTPGQTACQKPSSALQSSTRPVPVQMTAVKDSPFLPGCMWGIARTTTVKRPASPTGTESTSKSEPSSRMPNKKEAVEEADLKKGANADEELGDMSEWVSGDGEMCIIRKLPVDSDEQSDEDNESDAEKDNSQHGLDRDKAIELVTKSS